MATQQTMPAQAVATEQPASLLDRIVEEQARVAARYKPVMNVADSIERYKQIETFVTECMKEGIDYGKPPGFAKDAKPFLYKPGAQKLCAFFGYVPNYEEMVAIEEWTDSRYGESLFYYKFRCILKKDREPVGEGIGSCNSWESKYRYRNAERVCPDCNQPAIIKGKAEYGGGWLCWDKKGGCKSKFTSEDPRIMEQETGKVPNPDIADVINTCQKQGEKRAYVEATLSATGASAFFSQDEDVVRPGGKQNGKPEPQPEPQRQAGPPPPKPRGSATSSLKPPDKITEIQDWKEMADLSTIPDWIKVKGTVYRLDDGNYVAWIPSR